MHLPIKSAKGWVVVLVVVAEMLDLGSRASSRTMTGLTRLKAVKARGEGTRRRRAGEQRGEDRLTQRYLTVRLDDVCLRARSEESRGSRGQQPVPSIRPSVWSQDADR